MKSSLRFVVPIAILIAGYVLMQFFITFREEPPKRDPEPRQITTAARIIDIGPVEAEIVGYGRLRSAQPVQLISEVSGTLVSGDVPFLPGRRFNTGDTLISVDSRQVRLDLNTAKSDFLNALASVLPEIKVDFPERYEKWQTYFDACSFEGSIPELPETGVRRIKLFLSRYNVYKLYFNILNQEIRLEKHFFIAPFNGSIVTTDLRAGSSVRGGAFIGSIINLDNMEVEVPVPAEDIRWIDMTAPVKLTSTEIDGRWQGRVTRTGKAIDRGTQTIPVFISVGSGYTTGLYDGTFLKAEIPGKTFPASVEIPRKAIYHERYVYLIKNGMLDYREVDIVRKQTNTAIIAGGIADGDTLVTELLQGVSEGMPAKAATGTGTEGRDR